MKKLQIAVFCFALLSVNACSTWNKLDDTEKGAVIGGGAGASIGSIVSPSLGGAVVGGALGAGAGGLIGNEQEKRKRDDRKY